MKRAMELPGLRPSCLLALKAVGECESYAKAAEKLQCSEAYISQRLAELAVATKLTLLEKRGRRNILTDDGKELLVHAERLHGVLDDARRNVEELREGRGGLVRVAASTIVGSYVLPLALVGFCHDHPAVRLELNLLNIDSAHQRLVDRTADIAVTQLIEGDQQKEGLEIERFGLNELVVIAAPNHRFAGRGQVALKDLAAETFLLREPGSALRTDIERIFVDEGIILRPTTVFSGTTAIKQAVMTGLGVTIMARKAIKEEVRGSHLAVLDVARFPVARYWSLVRLARRHHTRTAQALWNWLLEYRSRQGLLSPASTH